jgi:hypothetical protein
MSRHSSRPEDLCKACIKKFASGGAHVGLNYKRRAQSLVGVLIGFIAIQAPLAFAQTTLGAGSTYSTIPGFNISNPAGSSSVFQGSTLTGLYSEDTSAFGGHLLEGPTNLTTAMSNVTLLETTPGTGIFTINSLFLPLVDTVGGTQVNFSTQLTAKAYFFGSSGSSVFSSVVDISNYSVVSTNVGTATSSRTGNSFTLEGIEFHNIHAPAGNWAEVAFAFQADGNTISAAEGGGVQGTTQTLFQQAIVGSTSETITQTAPIAVFLTAQSGSATAPDPPSGFLVVVGAMCASISGLCKRWNTKYLEARGEVQGPELASHELVCLLK